MKNYHLILVRHHSRPDGSICVRLRDERFNQSVFIPYTNEPGEHTEPRTEAIKWLKANGHNVIGQSFLKDDYVIILAPIHGDETKETTFKALK